MASDFLLTDLQTRQRHRSSTMSRALDRMRGNYAGAILTVNPGVAIAQAASLPTAGAVLGADTMAAVLPFVKNFSGKQRAAVEAEIRRHGDALLQYRLRGTKRGEMSSIGAHKNLVAKASEAMPAVTGWITGMDEITVEFLIAVLAARFQKYDVASRMVATILTSPSANARTKDKARELKDQILEELKSQKK